MTNISRRTLMRGGLGITAGLGTAPLLAACGGNDDTGGGDLTAMSAQFNWIKWVQWAGSYVADHDGYYEEEGLSVDLLTGGPNVDYMLPVSSGSALVGFGDFSGQAEHNSQGADYRILGSLYQRNPTCVLSLAENPIETPADLIGKRVGLSSQSQTIWTRFAATQGLDPEDVTNVPIEADPAPLAAGEIDAMFAFAIEQPVNLAVAGIEPHYFLLADYGYNFYTTTYFTTAAALADDETRDQLKRWLRADIRGQIRAIEDPEYAAELTVEHYGADLGLDLETQLLAAQEAKSLFYSPEAEEHGIAWIGGETLATSVETTNQIIGGGLPDDAGDLVDLSLLTELYDSDPELGKLPPL